MKKLSRVPRKQAPRMLAATAVVTVILTFTVSIVVIIIIS